MALLFQWDELKSIINFKKHGVTFEEAKTVFNDPFAITIADTEHSDSEQRFIDLGFSVNNRLIVVWYTERNNSIRIIGSRIATNFEIKTYEKE